MSANHPRHVNPYLVLAAAMVAIAWAAPLVRFATAPALVISAWRLIFSTLLVGGIASVQGGASPRARLTARDLLLAGLAGAALAGHFWTWVAAVQITTVASASVLVATSPLFVAVLSLRFLNERPSARGWAGMGLVLLGAVVVGWGDLALGGDALRGDLLALLGAVLLAVYLLVGRSLRPRLDLWRYVGLVYGAAAVILAATVALTPAITLTGYPRTDWLVFGALALGPMMVGHTGMNYSIRFLPAYAVNLAALSEPVGATLIAWLLPSIAETPEPATLLGGAAILLGIGLGLWPTVAADSETPN